MIPMSQGYDQILVLLFLRYETIFSGSKHVTASLSVKRLDGMCYCYKPVVLMNDNE